MNENKRKPALVTGGARRLGRRLSLALADRGYLVLVNHAHSPTTAEKTVAQIRGRGGDAEAVRADISVAEEVEAMVAWCSERYGPPGLLVNNAAIIPPSPFDQLTEEVWDRTLDVNLKGTFLCCREVGRLMRDSGGGRIVNIACLGGIQPWAGHIAYSVSKAGVIMLTRCLAKALAPAVSVNAVAPGTVNMEDEPRPTPLHPPEGSIPLGRYAAPADIVEAVIYFAENSGYVTGQVLTVDGGTSLQAIW